MPPAINITGHAYKQAQARHFPFDCLYTVQRIATLQTTADTETLYAFPGLGKVVVRNNSIVTVLAPEMVPNFGVEVINMIPVQKGTPNA